MYRLYRDHTGEVVKIFRTTDGTWIAVDEDNADYAEYLAWLEAGNTTAEVPSVVSRFQAKAALLDAGLLTQVNVLMTDANTPTLYKLAWMEARDFERGSATVAAMGAALGLTEEQIDGLFTAAAQITA